MDKYVPSKIVRKNMKQPWINRGIKQLHRRKQKTTTKQKYPI